MREFDTRWRAEGLFSTRGPNSITGIKVIDVQTDDSLSSTAYVSFTWPSGHYADSYDVIITYTPEDVSTYMIDKFT
jgi:hypothetical protein